MPKFNFDQPGVTYNILLHKEEYYPAPEVGDAHTLPRGGCNVTGYIAKFSESPSPWHWEIEWFVPQATDHMINPHRRIERMV